MTYCDNRRESGSGLSFRTVSLPYPFWHWFGIGIPHLGWRIFRNADSNKTTIQEAKKSVKDYGNNIRS